jgi:type II restriction enzyme
MVKCSPTATKLNAKKIYKALVEEGLIGSYGVIKFSLEDVELVVNDKNVVGNIIQDWIGEWMKTRRIQFKSPDSTQEFPDFFLDVDNEKQNLLEIKAFDYDASPNFDIANFEAYCGSLKTRAYRLDADYLIFGYNMDHKGKIKIANIWLKKIWEIAGSSEAYPVRIQQKRGMIYNIRPIIWYGEGSHRYACFESKLEFVKALHQTLLKYSKTRAASGTWLEEVKRNYKVHTGNEI